MIKHFLSLLLLLNLYNSKEMDNAIFYEVHIFNGKGGEFNVKVGDIFALKLFTGKHSWVFLNKNEIKESISFIKSDYINNPESSDIIGLGRSGYIYYYFKAISPTKEPVLLNFTDAYSYLKQENPIPREVFKINVE